MKKCLIVLLMLVMATAAFAGDGSDKIGGYIGYPIGLSYSHEFSDLVELDLVFGNRYRSGVVAYLGALFTVYEPIIDGMDCPLTVGPSLGFGFEWPASVFMFDFEILANIRWEWNSADVPLNVFVDFAPGVGFTTVAGYSGVATGFACRGGVGLRYVF